MKTIASAVENYIKKKPFLQTSLSQGIINLTALARIIQEDIQRNHFAREVKTGAIVMALKRLAVDMEFRDTHRFVKILKNIDNPIVRTELTDYTFSASQTLMNCQAELLQLLQENAGAYYAWTKGGEETSLIVSSDIENLVEKVFKNEQCLHKFTNLTAISVRLPMEDTMVSGIYYFIFQRLAWEGVRLNEVISTTNEFTFIIPEEQEKVAFNVIKNLKLLK